MSSTIVLGPGANLLAGRATSAADGSSPSYGGDGMMNVTHSQSAAAACSAGRDNAPSAAGSSASSSSSAAPPASSVSAQDSSLPPLRRAATSTATIKDVQHIQHIHFSTPSRDKRHGPKRLVRIQVPFVNVHPPVYITLDLDHTPTRCALLAAFCVSMAYVLMFSFRTHVILALLFLTCCAAVYALYDLIAERGLLAYMPLSVRDILLNSSLLDISQMKWSSGVFTDLLTLFLFRLDEDQVQQIVMRLPPSIRQTMSQKGVAHLVPGPVQAFLLSRDGARKMDRMKAFGRSIQHHQLPLSNGNAANAFRVMPVSGAPPPLALQRAFTEGDAPRLSDDEREQMAWQIAAANGVRVPSATPIKNPMDAIIEQGRSALMSPGSFTSLASLPHNGSFSSLQHLLNVPPPSHGPHTPERKYDDSGLEEKKEMSFGSLRNSPHDRYSAHATMSDSGGASNRAGSSRDLNGNGSSGGDDSWGQFINLIDSQFRSRIDNMWKAYFFKYLDALKPYHFHIKVLAITTSSTLALQFAFNPNARRWAARWVKWAFGLTLYTSATLSLAALLSTNGFAPIERAGDKSPRSNGRGVSNALARIPFLLPDDSAGRRRRLFVSFAVLLTWIAWLRGQRRPGVPLLR